MQFNNTILDWSNSLYEFEIYNERNYTCWYTKNILLCWNLKPTMIYLILIYGLSNLQLILFFNIFHKSSMDPYITSKFSIKIIKIGKDEELRSFIKDKNMLISRVIIGRWLLLDISLDLLDARGSILLTWINFNPSMNRWLAWKLEWRWIDGYVRIGYILIFEFDIPRHPSKEIRNIWIKKIPTYPV